MTLREELENALRDLREGLQRVSSLVPHNTAYAVQGVPTPRFFPCPSCGALTLVGAQGERLTCALGWPHVCASDVQEAALCH